MTVIIFCRDHVVCNRRESGAMTAEWSGDGRRFEIHETVLGPGQFRWKITTHEGMAAHDIRVSPRLFYSVERTRRAIAEYKFGHPDEGHLPVHDLTL
jgi:hypothetical protein